MKTSAFDAQKALYDALVGAAGLAGVPVYLGSVTGQVPEEFVYVAGEIDTGNQDYELSALSAKLETYDLRVEAFTQYSSDDFELIQTRLDAISTSIENAVHANSTLSGTVMLAQVSRFRMEEAVYEGSRQGLLTMWIGCEAWLA